MPSRSELPLVIRVSRAALGLTQQALAQRAGVDPDTVSRIESGTTKPRQGTLVRIIRALAGGSVVPPVQQRAHRRRSRVAADADDGMR